MGSEFEFLRPGVEAVVTEKMDGESITFTRHRYHARSIDSMYHPSRSVAAKLHGEISWMIPENRRIILENCYGEHSISYRALPSFLLGIAVVDESENGGAMSLSWNDTLEVFEKLNIPPVPVLHRGEVSSGALARIFQGLDFSSQEGIVARSAGSFMESEFSRNVGKALRPGHVQTDEHWLRTWRPNSLA